jgi:hypothetical protein
MHGAACPGGPGCGIYSARLPAETAALMPPGPPDQAAACMPPLCFRPSVGLKPSATTPNLSACLPNPLITPHHPSCPRPAAAAAPTGGPRCSCSAGTRRRGRPFAHQGAAAAGACQVAARGPQGVCLVKMAGWRGHSRQQPSVTYTHQSHHPNRPYRLLGSLTRLWLLSLLLLLGCPPRVYEWVRHPPLARAGLRFFPQGAQEDLLSCMQALSPGRDRDEVASECRC